MTEKPDDTATLAAATFPPLSDEQCARVGHLLSLTIGRDRIQRNPSDDEQRRGGDSR